MRIVILAGGKGTRLWPISTDQHPKQFARLFDGKSLVEIVFERFAREIPHEKIYFSVSRASEALLRAVLPDVSSDQFIVEPEKRDTAPAIGYVAAVLSRTAPDEPVMFVPSDHIIAQEKIFLQTVLTAGELVKERGVMVDIAVPAMFPSTVLGYTHIGKKIEDRDGVVVYAFKGHKEKPDFATAKRYLKDKNYLWHASYFTWTPARILAAFDQHAPVMGATLRKLAAAEDEASEYHLFHELDKTSFDYAIVEKLQPEEVLILKGEFGWNDVGAWDMFADHNKHHEDADHNIVLAKRWAGLDTSGCLIHSTTQKLIATIGVDGLVIIDTPDAILICPKSRAQDVKKIVEQLKRRHEPSS